MPAEPKRFSSGGCRDLFRPSFHEVDVFFDLGDVIFPVVLVFDGNMAVKPLFLKFLEAGGHIDDAFTCNNDRCLSGGCLILEMNADDASVENPQALHGNEI